MMGYAVQHISKYDTNEHEFVVYNLSEYSERFKKALNTF